MARNVTDHGTPQRFVAGTIGMPGDRTFYLQSRSGADVVTVVLAKQQVALLAEKLNELPLTRSPRFPTSATTSPTDPTV